MNQFFYSELKVKCREIALDLNSNGKSAYSAPAVS